MPEIKEQFEVPVTDTNAEELDKLPFPPLTKRHILNCSYHAWHPRYRSITPKARLIPLTAPFLSYLRADGIVLPPDNDEVRQGDISDDDSGIFSSTENPDATDDVDDEDDDPSTEWRDVHENIQATIAELGGKVVPKLNWSAPKDATWINATNSMECRSANDIYLLLKSSDFVTHDLEHAFDDCVEDESSSIQATASESLPTATETKDVQAQAQAQQSITDPDIPYRLILRKHVQLNPSLEFRCFVRNRRLLALCQRDLNHFDFLFKDNLSSRLRSRIQAFFDEKLRDTFPDPSFVFDVYVPPPHERVWLVDVNPWAQRTDPLLYSWLELLTMDGPDRWEKKERKEVVVSIPLRPREENGGAVTVMSDADGTKNDNEDDGSAGSGTETPSDDEDEDVDAELWTPELRLVRRDDPEAYGFATPQYSAHKLPRDVVDASRGGEGSLREFAEQWKEVLARRQKEDEEASSDDE